MTDQREEGQRRRGDSMSWHAIADALAARLMYAQPCGEGQWHDPLGCPFCADADAMRLYAEKGGTARLPAVKGHSVFIGDLLRSEGTT